MTQKQAIIDYIVSYPGQRFTNVEIANALGLPLPSVRRATLEAMLAGHLEDGGPATYNPSVVTYVAPLDAEIHG